MQSLHARRSRQGNAMALLIRPLKKQPEVLDTDTTWAVMVEKIIVRKDGTMTFVFYNETKIKAGA